MRIQLLKAVIDELIDKKRTNDEIVSYLKETYKGLPKHEEFLDIIRAYKDILENILEDQLGESR